MDKSGINQGINQGKVEDSLLKVGHEDGRVIDS